MFGRLFGEWRQGRPGQESVLTRFNPDVETDLKQVQRLMIKYIDGWAEYDDTWGDSRISGSGDMLRRHLSGFTSLKEVLLNHWGSGSHYSEPGHLVLEIENVRVQSPDLYWDDEDDDCNPPITIYVTVYRANDPKMLCLLSGPRILFLRRRSAVSRR